GFRQAEGNDAIAGDVAHRLEHGADAVIIESVEDENIGMLAIGQGAPLLLQLRQQFCTGPADSVLSVVCQAGAAMPSMMSSSRCAARRRCSSLSAAWNMPLRSRGAGEAVTAPMRACTRRASSARRTFSRATCAAAWPVSGRRIANS